MKKKNEITIRSSAAEYLTFIAATGDDKEAIEVRYEIVEGKAVITNCTGTIILYSKNDDLYNTLVENDWQLVER